MVPCECSQVMIYCQYGTARSDEALNSLNFASPNRGEDTLWPQDESLTSSCSTHLTAFNKDLSSSLR